MISVDLVDLEDVMQAFRLWNSHRWDQPFVHRAHGSDLGASSTERYCFVRPKAFENGIRERAFAPGIVDQLSRLTSLRSIDAPFWKWLDTLRFEGSLRWLQSTGAEPAPTACLFELDGRRVEGALFLRPIFELLSRASQGAGPTLKASDVSGRPTIHWGEHRTLSPESARTRSQLLHDASVLPAALPTTDARQYSLLVSAPRVWRDAWPSTLAFMQKLIFPDESVARFAIALELEPLGPRSG